MVGPQFQQKGKTPTFLAIWQPLAGPTLPLAGPTLAVNFLNSQSQLSAGPLLLRFATLGTISCHRTGLLAMFGTKHK